MAVFDANASVHDVDFALVQDSPITLFHRRAVLDETCGWLREHGYHLVTIDASAWADVGDLHTAVAAALGFPDYYGRGFDAMADCLRDLVDHDYGWPAGTTGLVVVLTGFAAFAARCDDDAQTLLDVFARAARDALLYGERLIVLVQSDDPQIRFAAVGAQAVGWNRAEWLDADRVSGPTRPS